jgi:hypothetical protein
LGCCVDFSSGCRISKLKTAATQFPPKTQIEGT